MWLRISLVIAALLHAGLANAAEICGDGLDNDSDGLADEQCYSNLTSKQCVSPLNCDEGDVSPSTGSLRYALPPDIAPRVPLGPSLAFSRFLLSQNTPGGANAYRKPMGDRWGHVFMSWLIKNTSPNPDQIIVHLPRGQETLFKQTAANVNGWDEYNTFQSGFHFQSLKQRVASPNEYELKTLTGEVLVYTSAGKLIQIRDSVATPNVLTIAYDVTSGQITTVTDATGKRRLAFNYTSSLLTSIVFQIDAGAGWQAQHTTTYGYTGANLTTVTIGSQLAQTNVYDGSGNVTQIQDGAGKVLVNFAYDSGSAGKAVRVDTPRGLVGYEFNSSRSTCSGKTVLAFHRANATSCSTDSDCGTGNICSGKTGTGSTGVCFRGARCLTVSSPSEDVITTITSFAGGTETCDGACLDAIDHVFNTTGGALDLTAVRDPSTSYTTKLFNGNGLPTKVVYGDSDSDPTGGGQRTAYMFYDTSFPGLVSEVRRKSDVEATGLPCTDSDARGCQRTVFTYTTDGRVDTVRQIGFTLGSSGTQATYDFTTNYDYDTKGRLTLIDGPLSGAADSTVLEYWSGAGALKDDFLKYFKRQTAPSGTPDYLTSGALDYDFWGNATKLQDPDTTLTCLTFDADRGYLTARRETMANQSACTSDSSDLVTQYLRDSALRLTKLTRPDGSCMIYEYDARGRLSKTKRRDDCNAASSGDREEYTYSDDGLVTKIETFDAAGTVTKRQEMTYFDSRRLEKVLNPVNTAKWTGFTYEDRGLIETIATKDSTTNYSKTEWSYNVEGRVASEKRYTSGISFDTWNLLFDWIGNQSEVTDGDSKATNSKRDDLGRMVKLTSPDLGGLPTLRLFDDASQLVTIKERLNGSGEQVHTFSYDPAGRQTEAEYSKSCQDLFGLLYPVPDIVRVYDALPTGVSCPISGGCNRLKGQLAYVKVKLMCAAAAGDDGDWTLEQETFYSYDDAGRVVFERMEDDSTSPKHVTEQAYEWTKNSALAKVTMPSTAVIGWTFGSGSSNSDADRITAMWRTNTSSPIADQILWEPYGPLKQYNQQNTSSTLPLRTVITHNLAYRTTKLEVEVQSAPSTDLHYVIVDEDEAGRTKKRIYFPSPSGIEDSWFKYDQQDRVLCETTSNPGSSCPTSGSSIKNSHTASPPFTAAGDWKQLKRPIPGSSDVTHDFTLASGTHQIAEVEQPTTLQTTTIRYNNLGNRSEDDNEDTQTYDERFYSYDSRRNVTTVTGKFNTGGAWHDYSVVSAFDQKNRRVFKSFTDTTASKTATWFFYYDALDRLIEIRHTPDISSSSTYSTYQLLWLGHRLVLYWQTDYPSPTTTTKRYVGTDEVGRPIDMICWGSGGANCPRVWSINADAWGFDRVLTGPNVFQPILFAGQYKDEETTAWRDATTIHRPGIALNGFRAYDAWTGYYLQVDPLVDSTWNTYVYVNSNPVGRNDRRGLMIDHVEDQDVPDNGEPHNPWGLPHWTPPDCAGWGCGDGKTGGSGGNGSGGLGGSGGHGGGHAPPIRGGAIVTSHWWDEPPLSRGEFPSSNPLVTINSLECVLLKAARDGAYDRCAAPGFIDSCICDVTPQYMTILVDFGRMTQAECSARGTNCALRACRAGDEYSSRWERECTRRRDCTPFVICPPDE